jgi:hypothetical protein
MQSDLLRKSNGIYEALVGHILRLEAERNIEATLQWVQSAAAFCCRFHSGRYFDGRIENIAFDAGKNLDRLMNQKKIASAFQPAKLQRSKRRHVLHVATAVYETGGHTRLMGRWIRNDPRSCHSLVVISQNDQPVSAWLRESVTASGGSVIIFPSGASLPAKAKWLRETACSEIDMAVLHHHPNDVVPIIAFATKECPPVAIMNHADHIFWLGCSIADAVLNIRNFAMSLSEKRRFAKKNLLLPIPLEMPSHRTKKAEARQRLGISENETALLSIGSAYKYRPTETHDFIRTVVKILDRNPEASLYLIGAESFDELGYEDIKHDRIRLLGIIDDPLLYQLSADLYLEGFPWGSLTALLETAALGVCPVVMYDPSPQLDVSGDPGLINEVEKTNSEDEYINLVSRLIRTREERIETAERIKEKMISSHAGSGWQEYLQDVYGYLECCQHEPRPLPASDSLEADEDINLSELNASQPAEKPVLLETCSRRLSEIGIGALMRFFYCSLKTGDTKLDKKYFREWLNLMARKIYITSHFLQTVRRLINTGRTPIR